MVRGVIRCFVACFALSFVSLIIGPVRAETVVERRIAALEPCKGIQTKIAGITLGIDKLKDVTLRYAKADLSGDSVTLSFAGGLSCRTSEQALFPGDASVEIQAGFSVELSSCVIRALSVDAKDFGGTYGKFLRAAWAPLIKPEIENEARAMLQEACSDFAGD